VTAQVVTVPLFRDSVPKPTQTFYMNLSGAVNAVISDPQGVGTIFDFYRRTICGQGSSRCSSCQPSSSTRSEGAAPARETIGVQPIDIIY
jgi:hypothetical protein